MGGEEVGDLKSAELVEKPRARLLSEGIHAYRSAVAGGKLVDDNDRCGGERPAVGVVCRLLRTSFRKTRRAGSARGGAARRGIEVAGARSLLPGATGVGRHGEEHHPV